MSRKIYSEMRVLYSKKGAVAIKRSEYGDPRERMSK